MNTAAMACTAAARRMSSRELALKSAQDMSSSWLTLGRSDHPLASAASRQPRAKRKRDGSGHASATAEARPSSSHGGLIGKLDRIIRCTSSCAIEPQASRAAMPTRLMSSDTE